MKVLFLQKFGSSFRLHAILGIFHSKTVKVLAKHLYILDCIKPNGQHIGKFAQIFVLHAERKQRVIRQYIAQITNGTNISVIRSAYNCDIDDLAYKNNFLSITNAVLFLKKYRTKASYNNTNWVSRSCLPLREIYADFIIGKQFAHLRNL